MTDLETEKQISFLRGMMQFIRMTLWQAPGSFLFCQAHVDDCPRAIDWCIAKIEKMLGEGGAT